MKETFKETINSLPPASIRSCSTSAKYDDATLEEHLGLLSRFSAGDIMQNREVLVAQINSLDAIFNGLACHVGTMVGKNPHAVDKYLRLALKAQAQCVRTIEVLIRAEANNINFDNQTIS